MKEPSKWLWGIFAWLVALAIFFPIFWMAITAFKTEKGAYSPDIIFMPTLESFGDVFARSNYFAYALNSIVISLGSTIVCFLIAVPAAYKMCFFPTQKTQDTLLWMLSTKMMPAVGVLLPIYVLFKTFHLLDSVPGLIIIYTLMNLPIAVWMSTLISARFRERYWRRAGSTVQVSGMNFGTCCARWRYRAFHRPGCCWSSWRGMRHSGVSIFRAPMQLR